MFPEITGQATWHQVHHRYRKTKKSPFTMVCSISPKIENDFLKQQILFGKFQRKSKRLQGIYCAVDGFNDNPEELGEIPEARAFCSRLCSSGFISMLSLTTTCEQLFDNSERLPIAKQGIVLGALEVFLIAEGFMKKGGRMTFDREVFFEFQDALVKANKVASALSAK